MRLRFGVFELDEEAGELRRAGTPVPLQPKPFDLLCLLVRERDRVVPSEELLDALWPDTVVTPASLARAVSLARRAIGDTGRGELLRSVARRGYRFTAEVEVVDAAQLDGVDGVSDADGTRGATGEARVGAGGAGGDDFVGRREPLEKLEAARDEVVASRSAVALVTGPAGIGKTRLVEVFAADLQRRGLFVVQGRCRDRDGAPPLWLWAQILRSIAGEPDLRDAIAALAAAGELDALLPALEQYAPDALGDRREPAAPDPALPADQRRFAFLEAASRALLACARSRPMVLLLEDLQWAGFASLQLLEHLALEISDAPVLLVATARDEPREDGHPLERTFRALRRLQRCRHLVLGGLSRGEVGQLLAFRMGQPAPADLTSELFARTEGVPFFVGEAIRLLEERGDLARPERILRHGVVLPTRAIDLVRRSLDGVSSSCLALLGAGSVLGREFTLTGAAHVADVPRAEALEQLDDAVQRDILEEPPGGVAHYRFRHALFQETLYDGLPASARARLHQRAADRLERQHAQALEPVLSELAHHHHRSIAVGDPERAFEIATRAARRAETLFAFDRAARHYEQALDALLHCEVVDPGTRLETLLALGDAHRLSGDRTRRMEVFAQAMEMARELARRREFTRAAIGFCDLSEWSATNERARAIVEDALGDLEVDDALGRTRLTTRLAYLSVRQRAVAEPIAREAVRLARELASPEALQEALYILQYVISSPDDLAERAGMLDELFEVAGRCTNRDLGVLGLLGIACDRLIEGDADGARRLRAEVDALVGSRPSPTGVWHAAVWDAGLALLEGRFDAARQGAQDALLAGRRIGHPFARACFDSQSALLDRERGDDAAVVTRLSPGLGSERLGATHWAQAVVGRAECASGEVEGARARLAGLAEPGFEAIPRTIRWNGTLAEIGQLCAELEAATHAKPLLELLATAPRQHGLLPMPISYSGPLARPRAALYALLGIADEALSLYDEALAASERLGARPTLARVAIESAAVFARSGDPRRARSLLTDGCRIAAELGMPALEQRGREALARH